MPNYNPSATETLGPEALLVGNTLQTVAAAGVGVAMRCPSLAAETINAVQLWMAKCDVGGTFALDIYPESSLPDLQTPADIFYNMYEDVTITNVAGVANNTTGQRYQNIDEGCTLYDTTDYIHAAVAGDPWLYEGRVGSAAYTGRPLSVTMRAVVHNSPAAGANYGSPILMGLDIGGVGWSQDSADSHNVSTFRSAGVYPIFATFYKNPSTGLPWTAAGIQAFDSTGALFFTFGGDKVHAEEHVVAMDLVVSSVTERRVATGTLNLTPFSTGQWKTWTIAAVGGGNWSKANATNYIYVLRRVSPAGSATLQSMVLGQSSLVTGFKGYDASVDSGMTTGLVDGNRWQGIIIRTTAPADSADSQVYAAMDQSVVTNAYTETTEFSNAAAKTYGVMNVLLSCTDDVNATLYATLKRRSDNAVMGSAVSIGKAQFDILPDLGNGWKKWTAVMTTPAVLAAGVQYYWQFTSSATVGSWSVARYSSGGIGTALTFGGTTDQGTFYGTEDPSSDLAVNFSTIPDVTFLFVASRQTELFPGDNSEGTTQNKADYMALQWFPTGFGSTFGYYEIQRQENDEWAFYCPGWSGNYVSTPSSLEAWNPQEIDIRVRVSAPDWSPNFARDIISKWQGSPNLAWLLTLASSSGVGFLQFGYSTDGTSANWHFPTTIGTTLPFVDGQTYWIRFTRQGSTGANSFYYAPDSPTMPTTWSLITTTVEGAGLSMAAVGAQVEVGSESLGAAPWSGRIYYAETRNGIDGQVTVVMDAKEAAQSANTTWQSVRTGQYWASHGPGLQLKKQGSGWKTVQFIEDQPVTAWMDWECKRNVRVEYRLRFVRNDGVPSQWTYSHPSVYVYGGVGDYLSTPDHANYTGTNTMRLMVLAATNWNPGASGGYGLMAHSQDPNQLGWRWELNSGGGGSFAFLVSSNGTSWTVTHNSVAHGITDYWSWIGVEYNTATGVLSYYKAPQWFSPGEDFTGWTLIQTATVAAVTPFNSNSVLEVGSVNNGGNYNFSGRIGEARMYRADLAGVLAGFSARNYTSNSQTVIGNAGELWTSHGNVGPEPLIPAKLAPDVWSFVSNENQGAYNVSLKKFSGGSYTFPSADEMQLHAVFGQNYYVALRPTEDRGARTELSVMVSNWQSFNQSNVPGSNNVLGWPLYNRLRALSTAPLQYVCVHDPWDNRMLAVITVPEGPIGGSESPWVAVIHLAQITDAFSTSRIV